MSQLILLNEASQRNGIPLPDMVPSAQQIRQAIDRLVLAAQKLVIETSDDVSLRTRKYFAVYNGLFCVMNLPFLNCSTIIITGDNLCGLILHPYLPPYT